MDYLVIEYSRTLVFRGDGDVWSQFVRVNKDAKEFFETMILVINKFFVFMCLQERLFAVIIKDALTH